MQQVNGQRRIRRAVACGVLVCGWLVAANDAAAYKPEDPEIRAMVDRAVRYLEGLSEKDIKATPYGGADGQVVLAAYAHFKAEHNPNAALVQLGLKHALQYVATAKATGGRIEQQPKTHYEVAVVILFLAELDPFEYAEELELLGTGLLNLQKAHGGYGYPMWDTGDVSQVQYIALALWTLDRAGINVSLDRGAKMLGWIMRVQDTSGLWPYQGRDPGIGRGLIPQPREEMSVTMGLAGGSAALITADVFRIWDNTTVGNKIEGLPKSLKPVEKSSVVEARRKKSPVKQEEILAALRRMDSFRGQHPYEREKTADWYYYMLYTLERYESFMEMATGKPSNASWYDDEVENLMALQDAAGAWGVKDPSKNNGAVSTSFAILFLIRSTQKAIGNVSKGTLAGGFGLPKDTAEIQVKGTQIVSQPVATAVTDLLDLLEGDAADDIDGKSIPEDLKLETDPERRAAQLDRLSRLLRGSQSWQARRVAARLLGKSDELVAVPPLIYALSDPDKKVRAYALDGLNYISRKFESEMTLDDATAAQISQMQDYWIRWYKTIDPSYVYTEGY